MRVVYRYLGYLLCLSAVFRFVPIGLAFYLGESYGLFAFSAFLSLIFGFILIYLFRFKSDIKEYFSLKHGLILSAISFILLPAIGAISFLPSLDYHLVDAYFESVSGFTTTGLTVYQDLDSLPRSLVLWRAMTQWLGGIGVVTIFLFIFSRLHNHDYINLKEVQEESIKTLKLLRSQGIEGAAEGGLKGSLKSIIVIYIGYTLLGALALWLVGLSVLDSFGLAFTSISTGGFSMSNDFNQNAQVLWVLNILMLLGATSFTAHNKLLMGKLKEFLKSFEKNLMLAVILISSITLIFIVPKPNEVFFQVISAFTTTGFGVSDISLLPELFILVIMVGMMVGGTFASTAGGMKLYRVYYLVKTIPWSIRKLIAPDRAIIPLKIQDKPVDEAKIVNIGIFIFTYLLILFIGTVIFMLFGHSFFNSSFQVFSALGTAGLQTMDIVSLNSFLKSILIIAMLLGRLEIFPILILMKNLFSKRVI